MGPGTGIKKRPALVWTIGFATGRDHVRQSFSRLRLIAPRLNLRMGRIDGRASWHRVMMARPLDQRPRN